MNPTGQTDVLTTSWGRGWYLRALNIPEKFRDKVCYHCGRVIRWGEEANLKEVPVPFSAHIACHKHERLVHMTPDEFEREKVIQGRHFPRGLAPVDDEAFNANLERCLQFLGARLHKKLWILFLNFVNGEGL